MFTPHCFNVEMTAIWMTLAVSAAGIVVAAIVWIVSLRPHPAAARRVLAAGATRRTDIALTSGGLTRGIDSDLVGLVERGVIQADSGRLTVVGAAAEGRVDEIWLLTAVREAGDGGLDAVRERMGRFGYQAAILRLIKRRLIISPDRVQYGPTLVWGPTLAALFLCSLPLIVGGSPAAPGMPAWAPAAISIGAWVVIPLVQILIWCRQPGYHGQSPVSRLGLDVISEFGRGLGVNASQADRVAIGGLAAMTDAPLREAVQGTAADSAWNARLWRKRVFAANSEARASPTLG